MTQQRTRIDFDLDHDPGIRALLELALREDLGEEGDVTSRALMPDARLEVVMTTREPCVLAGIPLAERVFRTLDPAVEIERLARDGEAVGEGTELLLIRGAAAAVLSAERTALNFLQRLCAVATQTRRYVDVVTDLGTQILDTRKTTPGWRLLEKYAVACGGGVNHRAGLYDQVLIKDNHLAHWRRATGRSIADAVAEARRAAPGLLVEVEADTVPQVERLLEARPDWILLDNMSFLEMEQAVALCKGRCLTEASGGITLDTLRGVAETGVDAISVGALTHSVRAVDIGLDFS